MTAFDEAASTYVVYVRPLEQWGVAYTWFEVLRAGTYGCCGAGRIVQRVLQLVLT